MINARLYREASRIVDEVDADARRSNTPLNKLYPSLVEELSRCCPGFSKSQYEMALQHAFGDSR
jgi:hypothetical protein